MSNGEERRAQVDTETVKGLQLMNGGMAAGLVALLPVVLQTEGLRSFSHWMLAGIFLGATGLVAAVIHNRLRRKCSLEYSKSRETREPPYTSKWLARCQSVPGEPQICTKSVMWMWGSLILFCVGAVSVGIGSWKATTATIGPTNSCWELTDFAGRSGRFNTCTGEFEPMIVPR